MSNHSICISANAYYRNNVSQEHVLSNENGEPITVYRGGQIYNNSNQNIFFSESERFASGFDERVKLYFLHIENPFNSLNPEHLHLLFDRVNEIEDPFDNSIYKSPEEFLDALSSDTWSAIEQYKDIIDSLGFDGVIITEDGYRNYIINDPKQAIPPYQKTKKNAPWFIYGDEFFDLTFC